VAEARAKAAAESRQSVCIRDYGPGYEVGHILEDGRFFCKPTQSVASAWCENKYGSGYFARNINSRGGFDCMPTKQAADAWCNRNNTPNSGWHASSIQPNGQFTCHLSEAAQRAAATADCRQRYGQRLIRVYKQNGQYWCQHQQGQPVARQQPTRQQPTRQQPARDPQADAAAAAAAAAVAGAVIQGIQSSRNRGRAPPPQQRCHRNPRTGQVHCGAN
jgi:hypothetical protein